MDQYIVFTNKGQNFAIDVSKIERIIEYKEPKKIPESSNYLLGIITHNERILPIIDLSKRLYGEYSSYDVETKVVVIMWKEKQLGLLVESIIGIRTFEEDEFEKSMHKNQIPQEYITGFIKSQEEITIVLDVEKIFTKAEEKEILDTGIGE